MAITLSPTLPIRAHFAIGRQVDQEEAIDRRISIVSPSMAVKSPSSSIAFTATPVEIRKASPEDLKTELSIRALNRKLYARKICILVASLVSIVALATLASASIALTGGASIIVGAFVGAYVYQRKEVLNFEQTAGKWLSSPEVLTKTEREWCQEVIKIFNISPNHSVTGLVIPLELPADKYQYYCTLQEEIAQLIPNERDRPIIDLRLRGSEATENQPSFGIIGGVGPLSDAAILKLTMEELREKNLLQKVKIDLYSSPPPRKEAMGHLIWNIMNYIRGIKAFLNRSTIAKFCITSNTAHLNLGRLKNWLGAENQDKMISLVEAIGRQIQQDHIDPKRVLVLGTIEAYQGRLYPNVLNNLGVESCTLDDADSLALQAIIDQVKSGKNDEANVRKLLQFLEKGLREATESGTPVTHILLGCTELPLALAFQDGEGEVARAVRNLKEQYQIVDSEEFFAHSIDEEISSIIARS